METPLTLLRSVLVLVLAGLSLVSAGPAAAQGPSRETVRELLSGFEESAGVAEWRSLGDATVPVLVALFDDRSELQPVRLRAVWAARFYATDASRRFLSRVLADPAQPGMVVRTAVQSLSSAFGASALNQIRPLLAHADPAVREASIVALGQMGSSEARAALEARRGTEHDLAELLTQTLASFTH